MEKLKFESTKLNLGCWNDYREGWVNLDFNKENKADVYHNLDVIPYPFEDNSFDLIVINMVLEHLYEPLKVIEELWRISKNGGKIEISVPHWNSYIAYTDLTHRSFFSAMSFFYFEKGKPKYYSDFADFKVTKKKYISYRTAKKLMKPYEWLCRGVFEPIANFNPQWTEELFCKFIPINGIDFELVVVKN